MQQAIAHLHDDVMRALHSGSCSQTPGKFKTMEANEACQDACKYVNKSNKKPFRTILTEEDIPGASLKGRKAEQLKNDELKRWLKCRGASVSGTRMQLIQR